MDRHSILLVDDNHIHQYSLGKHLDESGFKVVHACTGEETLTLALAQDLDAILLDIHLPDMTGFEICRHLKANEKTKNIPVIFHSATYDTQNAQALAKTLGAVSFLTYPIDIEHLITVIRAAVVRERGHTA